MGERSVPCPKTQTEVCGAVSSPATVTWAIPHSNTTVSWAISKTEEEVSASTLKPQTSVTGAQRKTSQR